MTKPGAKIKAIALLRAILLIPLALQSLCQPVQASETEVVFVNFQPVSYLEQGQLKGPGLLLAQRLIAGLDLTLNPEPVPVKRVMAMSRERPIVIVALARFGEREEQLRWIAELYQDALVVGTLRGAARIDSLDQARQLERLGVSLGSAAELILRSKGFTNIDVALDYATQAKKMKQGRTSGWCGLRSTMSANWLSNGYDEPELQIGAPIVPLPIWMAASKSVPEPLIAALQGRIASMKAKGEFAALFAELQP